MPDWFWLVIGWVVSMAGVYVRFSRLAREVERLRATVYDTELTLKSHVGMDHAEADGRVAIAQSEVDRLRQSLAAAEAENDRLRARLAEMGGPRG